MTMRHPMDHHAHRGQRTRGDIQHGEGRGDQPRHEKTITGVRRPYNCVYKVQGVAALAGTDDPINGNQSNPYAMYWPVSGFVREMYGTVRSSDETVIQSGSPAAMANVGVTITVLDGREDLFKSAGAAGNAGADFNTFAALFGAQGDRVFLLERPIYAALAWQVRFTNFLSSDLDVTLTPDLSFFMDEDPHGIRRQQFSRIEVPEGVEIEVFGPHGKRTINT